MSEHTAECRWERTTTAECEYRATHHYCPHAEHACDCLTAVRERANGRLEAATNEALRRMEIERNELRSKLQEEQKAYEQLSAAFTKRATLLQECETRLGRIVALVNEQAEDEGLWFVTDRISEDYLQQELRRLHAAIEGVTPDECAKRVVERQKP